MPAVCAKAPARAIRAAAARGWSRGFCLAVALALAWPSVAAPAAPSAVTVARPWIRYLLPSLPAVLYLRLTDAGDLPAVLTGAASPACGALLLHASSTSSGMAMMTSLAAITVPAHGAISLAPGGLHLMCMHPRMAVGGRIAVRLRFQDGAAIRLLAPVYGARTGP